jgi:4-amino-4-deoxy-L-arabinose transferase-like glycosyltransferase
VRQGRIARLRLPLLVFTAILLQGAWIGLTDDEAYYWVLAQKPASGYAFHPPAVALCISLAQAAFGWIAGIHSEALVRLPAAALAAGLVWLGMRWFSRASVPAASSPERGGLVLVAFAGIYALSWMMVPDFPLLAGWTLAFIAAWELCFAERMPGWAPAALALGLALAILSKYSGVLAAASAAAAILKWAPRERRIKAMGAVAAGVFAASLPILWWNSQHAWASILYQISERHGGAHLSGIRYLRFWLIELVLMGPALFIFLLGVLGRTKSGRASKAELYCLVWLAPGALVFCSQPLWADFKPHWALIVWWPAALAMGLAAARGELGRRLKSAHLAYGFTLIGLVWVSCHYPLLPQLTRIIGLPAMDPKLDVTNDLYGWSGLREAVPADLPVVGARYQTASQAAFALPDGEKRVTLLPRDLKAMDEWPDLHVSDGQGPDWPRLRSAVIFVGDNRYDAGPEYPGAKCANIRTLGHMRAGYAAKTIYVWKCEPGL